MTWDTFCNKGFVCGKYQAQFFSFQRIDWPIMDVDNCCCSAHITVTESDICKSTWQMTNCIINKILQFCWFRRNTWTSSKMISAYWCQFHYFPVIGWYRWPWQMIGSLWLPAFSSNDGCVLLGFRGIDSTNISASKDILATYIGGRF